MHDPDLVPLLGMQWPRLDHRVARAHLERLDWVLCGQGDWAYAFRSPRGRLVARLSPFEPGFRYFVDLCERCAGNRYLPRMDLATPLEGGGHLAVLEYLHAPERDVVQEFMRQWEHPAEADAELRALRHEVDRIDEYGRRHVRWWVGIDLGDRHVLLSTDGNPKVIDLFGLTSLLVDDLISDPQAFARHVPVDQCRYLLDMPDLQADDHPAGHLDRIRTALAKAASAS